MEVNLKPKENIVPLDCISYGDAFRFGTRVMIKGFDEDNNDKYIDIENGAIVDLPSDTKVVELDLEVVRRCPRDY